MPRNKFQKTLDGRSGRNDTQVRELLVKIQKLPDAKRLRIWTISVATSEFYRDMSKKAKFTTNMHVTPRQVKWLEDLFKKLKEAKV